MKITPKQYSESLYQVTSGKSKKEVSDALKNFVNVLIQNNDISKINKIIEQFEKIWNKEEGIVEAEIISSKELSSGIVKSIKDYIAKLLGAKSVIVNEEEDRKILGGVVIKYGDKVIDGSLKTKLNGLKNEMSK